MSALYDALVGLSPVNDEEMLDGYRRYEARLANLLTPNQMEGYAAYIRQSGVIRIFEELTAFELATLPADIRAIATAVKENQDISMENRRVVALLNQRGQHAVAPDLTPAY